MQTLPTSGELWCQDFRGSDYKVPELSRPLKVVQWNIERGYKLPEIISLLKNLSADIICLQELDIGCARSDYVDTFTEIGSALKMNGVFVTEFEEIYSDLRNAKTQGGGIHGNAVFSIFDMKGKAIDHSHHPFNWEEDGNQKCEPRKGKRFSVLAEVTVPGLSSVILCFSVHLEVFTGIMGRMKQFSDILVESDKRVESNPYQLIFGDLNTLAHSIARLSRSFCCDDLRWRTLGTSESQFWLRKLLSFTTLDGPTNSYLSRYSPRYLSEEDLINLRNPGFIDPFHVNITTLQSYAGLFKGKLDWTLCRGFSFTGKGVANSDYRASDHKLLWLSIEPLEDVSQENIQSLVRSNLREDASWWSSFFSYRVFPSAAILIGAILLFYKAK